jgi:hypothetical protein
MQERPRKIMVGEEYNGSIHFFNIPQALLLPLSYQRLKTELKQLVSSFHQTTQKVTDPQHPKKHSDFEYI